MTGFRDAVDSIQSPQTTRAPIPQAIMDAAVVLGYSGGNSWPTWSVYKAARPDLAKHNLVIPVTLSCAAFGHVYDIEPGGGTNGNIGVFMHNALHVWNTPKTYGLPWLYTFASNGAAMLAAARAFGYEQGRDFYYLSSHAGRGRHVCSPAECGFPRANGTQYEFAGAVDVSTIPDYMLKGLPRARPARKPKPTPAPKPRPTTPHLDWFDDTDRQLGGTHHGSERAIVKEYDEKRAHWLRWPGRLRTLRDDMGVLAGRLETVMCEDAAHNEVNRRQWRHEQLAGRAAGRRYV